jgi:hypothetical protein
MMSPDSLEIWGLAGPILAMSAIAAFLAGFQIQQTIFGRNPSLARRRFGLFIPSAALGFAFLTVPMMYRPNLALVVKAQIRQQEDADDDDNGDPDTPIRHLHRQLRRIRRGKPVNRLMIRRE